MCCIQYHTMAGRIQHVYVFQLKGDICRQSKREQRSWNDTLSSFLFFTVFGGEDGRWALKWVVPYGLLCVALVAATLNLTLQTPALVDTHCF